MLWARQKDTESHKRKSAADQPRPALGRRPWFALLRRARSLRRFALAIRRESVARSHRSVTLATAGGLAITDVQVATTGRSRRRGVRDHSRVLLRSSSVHGWGLAQPVRAVGVDGRGFVIQVAVLRRRRFLRLSGAEWTLELPITDLFPNRGERVAIYARRCDWKASSLRNTDRQSG